MANRRMVSIDIIDTDQFLDMSHSAQNLYFHFLMRADDDGFISSPKKIMRMMGVPDDDLKVLITKKYLIPFESGVVVIKHWKIHNYIKKDRYKETMYIGEKAQLKENKENVYSLVPECIQSGSKSEPQVRVRVRSELELEKEIEIDKDKYCELSSQINAIFNIFYKINPTINWGNKTSRKSAEFMIKKFGFEGVKKMAEQIVAVQGQEYCPVATTPYQMKEKLTQFKIFFDKNNNNKGIRL